MENSNTVLEPIPDEVYKEAQMYDAIVLLRENMHWKHNLDVTDGGIYCSDCAEVVTSGE